MIKKKDIVHTKLTNKKETYKFFLKIFFLSNLTLFSRIFISVVLPRLLDVFPVKDLYLFVSVKLSDIYKK